MQQIKLIIFLLLMGVLNTSCYNFKGFTVAPNIKTFYVEDSQIKGLNDGPPEIGQLYSESLRQKVREQSRLNYSEIDPHVYFEPTISKYQFTNRAPSEGNNVALTRLTITISIDFVNTLDETQNFSKNYTEFDDFAASQNIRDIEEGLIDEIFAIINENLFNDCFSSW